MRERNVSLDQQVKQMVERENEALDMSNLTFVRVSFCDSWLIDLYYGIRPFPVELFSRRVYQKLRTKVLM